MIQNCWVMFCQKQFQDFKFRCVWENDVLWVVGQLVYFVCLHQTNTDISGTINMKLNCLTIGIRQKHIELYERKPLHDLKIKFYKANSDFLHCISYCLDWFLIFHITWMTNEYRYFVCVWDSFVSTICRYFEIITFVSRGFVSSWILNVNFVFPFKRKLWISEQMKGTYLPAFLKINFWSWFVTTTNNNITRYIFEH